LSGPADLGVVARYVAPLRPSQQREGVGSALIRDGIERCRDTGWTAAFVLGDPDYYHRFGWSSAADWGLRCKWEVPAPIFQAMELVPDGLSGWNGLVTYHPVFETVS
jgi:putative acetyltransferase